MSSRAARKARAARRNAERAAENAAATIALDPEAAMRQRIRQSQSSRAEAERRRARTLLASITDPPPDESIAAQVRAAEVQRELAERAPRGRKGEYRRRARQFERDAAEARERQLAQHWQFAAMAEIEDLALARGEQVSAERIRIASPITDEDGVRLVKDGVPQYRQETVSRVRILSRGGLQFAYERGDLGDGRAAMRLLDTGNAYRWAFETATATTTPAREFGMGGGSPLKASAGPQDAVFAAGEMLRQFRSGIDDRQRAVLDRVCGRDLTVSATAMALGSHLRTVRKLLVEGLRLAGEARTETQRRQAA